MKSVDKAGHSGLGKDVELVDLSGSGEAIIIMLSWNSKVDLSQFIYTVPHFRRGREIADEKS